MKTKNLIFALMTIFALSSWPKAHGQIYTFNIEYLNFYIEGEDYFEWIENKSKECYEDYVNKYCVFEYDSEGEINIIDDNGPGFDFHFWFDKEYYFGAPYWDTETLYYEYLGTIYSKPFEIDHGEILDLREYELYNNDSYHGSCYMIGYLDSYCLISTINPEGCDWKDLKKHLLFINDPSFICSDYAVLYGCFDAMSIDVIKDDNGNYTLRPIQLGGYEFGSENIISPGIEYYGPDYHYITISEDLSTLIIYPAVTGGGPDDTENTCTIIVSKNDEVIDWVSMERTGNDTYETTHEFEAGDKFFIDYVKYDEYGGFDDEIEYRPFESEDGTWMLTGLNSTNVPLYAWGKGLFGIDRNGNYRITVDITNKKLSAYRVSSTIVGDVDGNSIVDVDDVNSIINLILLYDQYKDKYPGNADVDSSSIIDVDDVNAVINIILGK